MFSTFDCNLYATDMKLLTKLNDSRVKLLFALKGALGGLRQIVVHDSRFEVHPKFSLDSALIRLRRFEPDLLISIEMAKIIAGSSAYLDIGANAGYWTIPLAKIFPHAIAFEPDPLVRERLLRNVALNELKDLTVSEFAVSDSSGTARLAVRRALDNSGALNDGLGSLVNFDSHLESTLEVPTTTLDLYLYNSSLVVRLIKIDVEGAEDLVLRGARSLLEHHRPIVVSELLFPVDAEKASLLASRISMFPETYLHFEVVNSRLRNLELVNFDELSDLNVFSIPQEHLENLAPLLA